MLHAELGASGAHRWMKCPGSIRMSEGIPDIRTDYAQEGTAAHALGERCLRKDVDPDAFLGIEIEGVTVDEEMVDGVQVYVDFVRQMFAGADETRIEERFNLDPLNPPGPMFGTSDAVAWTASEGLLEIADLKYGYLTVDVEENEQLMYYALGAVVALHVKPKRIRTAIVQPRAPHLGGIVRTYEFGWEELVAFKKVLFDAARRTLEPDAPLVIGEHCRFCKALPVCPAQHENALAVAQEEFTAQPVPLPEQMTEEQLLMVLDKASLVEDWFRAVRGFAQAKLEAGEEVPGWKLVEKRETRKWKDEEEAAAWARSPAVSVDPYLPKMKSPAQIEAELKKRLPRGKKKLASETLEQSGLVVKESSGFNLARADDPRPAIGGMTAEEEFAALPAAASKSD